MSAQSSKTFVNPAHLTHSEVVAEIWDLVYATKEGEDIAIALQPHDIDMTTDFGMIEAAVTDREYNRRLLILLRDDRVSEFAEEVAEIACADY